MGPAVGKHGGISTALVVDAIPGPSTSALYQGDPEGRVSSAPLHFAGIPLGDFPLDQSCHETLKHAFDQVRVFNGQKIQPNVTLSYLYFSIIKDRSY